CLNAQRKDLDVLGFEAAGDESSDLCDTEVKNFRLGSASPLPLLPSPCSAPEYGSAS
ncbi:hypothetical protein GOODEAATRI_030765, partial [Goodea atripinnis]